MWGGKKSLISSAGILSIVCKVQYRCSVSGAYLCNMLTARGDVIYLPGPLSLAKIIISCIRSQQSLEKINIQDFILIKTATSGSTRFVLFICSRFFHLCVNATLFPLGVKLTQTYTSQLLRFESLAYKTPPVDSRYHREEKKNKKRKEKQPLCVTNIKQWQSDQHDGMPQINGYFLFNFSELKTRKRKSKTTLVSFIYREKKKKNKTISHP